MEEKNREMEGLSPETEEISAFDASEVEEKIQSEKMADSSAESSGSGKKGKRKLSLAGQIFIALVLAIIIGLLIQPYAKFAETYITPFGTIFLNLIKFIVGPIVLFSIMAGIVSMRDIRKVGQIGGTTIVYYLCTTAFATTIGLIVGNLMKGMFPVLSVSNLSYETPEKTSFMDTLVNIFPSNFLAPLYEANMLQVIVMALIIGFAIILVGERAQPAVKAINVCNDVFMKCMEMILKLSPIGVFCLLCPVIAANGSKIIGSLASVLLVAYICYVLHVVIVYSATVRTMGGMSPLKFFKGMMPAMLFAFSSASSVGTLPLNMECCENLGASKEVASFVLPLGATINMDGTAIYQGVCSIFIAACYGITLTPTQMISIVLTATLASIGTAGVPGAGMVMLSMVLQSVGLPVEGIALVAGVDRIFDMGRTTVNITGDASCAVIVSHLQEKRAVKRAKKAAV
jgi:Na+/H+-dicarboxylate symporter